MCIHQSPTHQVNPHHRLPLHHGPQDLSRLEDRAAVRQMLGKVEVVTGEIPETEIRRVRGVDRQVAMVVHPLGLVPMF